MQKILNICTIIFDKSVGELISKEQDFTFKFENEEEAKTTFELANLLFNEIIMQDKIRRNKE